VIELEVRRRQHRRAELERDVRVDEGVSCGVVLEDRRVERQREHLGERGLAQPHPATGARHVTLAQRRRAQVDEPWRTVLLQCFDELARVLAIAAVRLRIRGDISVREASRRSTCKSGFSSCLRVEQTAQNGHIAVLATHRDASRRPRKQGSARDPIASIVEVPAKRAAIVV